MFRFFEAETNPRLKHLKAGTLSMVNNGSGCHTSQFFLTLSDNLDNLDGNHTVFGEVAEGFDVLMKISEVYCDKDDRPFQDIRIYHTVVLEDPFDDPEGKGREGAILFAVKVSPMRGCTYCSFSGSSLAYSKSKGDFWSRQSQNLSRASNSREK